MKTIGNKILVLTFILVMCMQVCIPTIAHAYFALEEMRDAQNTITKLSELKDFSSEIIQLNTSDNLKADNDYTTKRLVVVSETSEFNTYGATSVISYGNLYVLSYKTERATKKAYQSLKKESKLTYVEIDKVIETANIENSTFNNTYSNENTSALYNYLKENINTSEEVKVAILDTGIDTNNKLYKNRTIDLGLNLSNSGEKNSIYDDNGHGSRMAEIITQNTNNNIKIVPIKIANNEGKATILNTYLAIQNAINNNVDVINISMNTNATTMSSMLSSIINEATEKGIVVVTAAGNEGSDVNNNVPANIESAITVGATNKAGEIQYFSNHGNKIDYVAISESGTSDSAAFVSSIIAQIKTMNKNYTTSNIQEILNKYAIDLGDKEYDEYYGNGLISMYNIDTKENENTNNEKNILDYQDSWKELNIEEFNSIVSKSQANQVWIFLNKLPEEDLSELLSKKNYITESTTFVARYYYNENTQEYCLNNGKKEYKYLDYLIEEYGPLNSKEEDLKTNVNFMMAEGTCYLKIIGPDSEELLRTISIKVKENIGSLNYANVAASLTVTDTGENKFGYAFTPSATLSAGGNGHYYIYQHVFSFTTPSCTNITYSNDVYNVLEPQPSGGPMMELDKNYNYSVNAGLLTYQTTRSFRMRVNVLHNMGLGTTDPNVLGSGWGFLYSTLTVNVNQAHSTPTNWEYNSSGHYKYCANGCGTLVTNASAHTYSSSIVKEATCTEKGTTRHTCSTCGYSYDADIPALGHNSPSDYSYAINNNIANGLRYKNCTRCSTRLESAYLVSLAKGTGIESVTGGGTYYNEGATVTIDATVKENYNWDRWTGGYNPAGTEKGKSFTMPATAFSLTANATLKVYTISLDQQGGTGGTASIYETYGTNYNNGTSTISNITKPTKTGYTFGGYFTRD